MKTQFTLLLMMLFLTSCSYDNDEKIIQSGSDTSIRYVDEDYYKSIKEDGELLYMSGPASVDFEKYGKRASEKKPQNREKLTKQHLAEFGFTDESLFQLFKGYKRATLNPFTRKPDGIVINDYSTKNAKHLDLAKKYGGTTYLELGEPIVEMLPSKTGSIEYRSSETWVSNRGNTEDELAKEFVYITGTTTKWNVAVTAGITTSFKVGLPFVGDIGAEVSLSTTTEGGGEKSNQKEVRTSYMAKIPPRSKRKVVMIEKITEKRLLYKVPIKITGTLWTAQHIPYHSGGATPAEKLMDGIPLGQRYQSWEITVKDNTDVEIYAEEAISLN